MPLINPFDHVISEFRIPPNEMPSLSSPSQAPTYQSLRTFQKALNHNAMSIHSTQTRLGHLHLVITKAKYLEANDNVPFKVPTDPEATESTDEEADDDVDTGTVTRSMFALSSTSTTDPTSDTLQSIKTFELQQQKYFKYNATVVALRNLILNAVDNKYITDLEDDLTGYAKVSPLELMTHLWTSYGTVDDADHAANEEAMKKPWTPPEPIATLFDQLKKGQEFAARGNEVIDDTQLIRWGYQNIKNTGLFNRECERWRKKEPKEKSWKDFKKHFILAYDDHLKYDSPLPPPLKLPTPPTRYSRSFKMNYLPSLAAMPLLIPCCPMIHRRLNLLQSQPMLPLPLMMSAELSKRPLLLMLPVSPGPEPPIHPVHHALN